MEEYEILDFESSDNGLVITPQSRSFLLEVAKWARFIAIIGFIFLGLMAIGLLMFGVLMGTESSMGQDWNMASNFVLLLYALFLGLYFFPMLYLFRFSVKMKDALNTNNVGFLNEAFHQLKAHYKFLGILLIIFLSIYVLLIIFTLIGFSALGQF